MSDLLPNDSPTNAAEFTVSEISGALKRVVDVLPPKAISGLDVKAAARALPQQ